MMVLRREPVDKAPAAHAAAAPYSMDHRYQRNGKAAGPSRGMDGGGARAVPAAFGAAPESFSATWPRASPRTPPRKRRVAAAPWPIGGPPYEWVSGGHGHGAARRVAAIGCCDFFTAPARGTQWRDTKTAQTHNPVDVRAPTDVVVSPTQPPAPCSAGGLHPRWASCGRRARGPPCASGGGRPPQRRLLRAASTVNGSAPPARGRTTMGVRRVSAGVATARPAGTAGARRRPRRRLFWAAEAWGVGVGVEAAGSGPGRRQAAHPPSAPLAANFRAAGIALAESGCCWAAGGVGGRRAVPLLCVMEGSPTVAGVCSAAEIGWPGAESGGGSREAEVQRRVLGSAPPPAGWGRRPSERGDPYSTLHGGGRRWTLGLAASLATGRWGSVPPLYRHPSLTPVPL